MFFLALDVFRIDAAGLDGSIASCRVMIERISDRFWLGLFGCSMNDGYSREEEEERERKRAERHSFLQKETEKMCPNSSSKGRRRQKSVVHYLSKTHNNNLVHNFKNAHCFKVV